MWATVGGNYRQIGPICLIGRNLHTLCLACLRFYPIYPFCLYLGEWILSAGGGTQYWPRIGGPGLQNFPAARSPWDLRKSRRFGRMENNFAGRQVSAFDVAGTNPSALSTMGLKKNCPRQTPAS